MTPIQDYREKMSQHTTEGPVLFKNKTNKLGIGLRHALRPLVQTAPTDRGHLYISN